MSKRAKITLAMAAFAVVAFLLLNNAFGAGERPGARGHVAHELLLI